MKVSMTVGIDLGDKFSHVCGIDKAGAVVHASRVRTTKGGFATWARKIGRARIAIETGAHARWVAELLRAAGHDVLVANAREVRLVFSGRRKNDKLDAEALARLLRFDPMLLRPVTLRSAEAHAARAVIMVRHQVVEARTKLINCIRGTLKSFGIRVRSGDANGFHKRAREVVTPALAPALLPTLETVEHLTDQIHAYDKQIENRAKDDPVSRRLMQVSGVGPLTSLSYVLTIEDPHRFRRSREVGPFLGLVPRQWQSGDRDPELGISKAGDPFLRQLLVQCAHYILGPFGKDCELRRFGQRIIERSGQTPSRGKKRTSPKKRAAVAVARKLAVLLHRLWVSDEDYQPLGYGSRAQLAA